MVDIQKFDFCSTQGFLPTSDPLISFSDSDFSDWELAAQNLPKLILSNKLHQILEGLPSFPLHKLDSTADEERAMLILSYLSHAYVWSANPPNSELPESLAVPWHAVSTKLGRPPVLSYASYALHNWRRIDPAAPIELGNICLLQNFMAGIDEEWFILIHVAIEAEAGIALNTLIDAQSITNQADPKQITKLLDTANQRLRSINSILCRMPEFCDPYVYFHRVRPYIHGWKNNPALPNGLIYKGVKEYAGQGQFFRGETGAQSSIVPCLDALLGIEHKEDVLKTFLLEMQDYMPPKHKALIAELIKIASLRKFVISKKTDEPELVEAYNQAVIQVEQFRDKHLEYASRYIQKQSQISDANPSQIGTGGTPFIPYLQKHRDESGEHLIS